MIKLTILLFGLLFFNADNHDWPVCLSKGDEKTELESIKTKVLDSSNSCGQQQVHVSFSICPGDTVFLKAEQVFPTLPPGPQGPNGSPPPVTPCTPQLDATEICPLQDAFAEAMNGFRVSPTVNTVYRVRSIGYCGPIAPDDFTHTQHDTVDIFYEILIDCPNGGSMGHNNLFEVYPWLTTIVDPVNCNNDQIAIYNQVIHNYLLVNGQLYYQDGTFYCQSSSTYDCVAAYKFGEAIYKWGCQIGGNGILAIPR